MLDWVAVLTVYSCSGKPIPKRVKYYLIKVDKEKIRVQSPITADKILIATGLDPCEYRLEQKFKSGKTVALEPDQLVDLSELPPIKEPKLDSEVVIHKESFIGGGPNSSLNSSRNHLF